MLPKSPAQALLLALFLLSGAAGLVYELVWTRQLIFVFGGTTYAITTVLVAFMGGLGLGSYVVGRIADRLRRPALIYGVLEVLIGLYALVVPSLLGWADPLYRNLYPYAVDNPGLLIALRFTLGCLILLVPTTLMGATLPLLVRFVVLRGGSLGSGVAALYGTNTLGAVFGVLATGFVLIPVYGLQHTTHIAAATNILIGLTAIAWLRGAVASVSTRTQTGPSDPRAAPTTLPPAMRRGALVALAVSGFAAMVYQVSWTRALVLCIGSSTYSFTCILAAFILGLGLGSLLVSRFVDRWRDPLRAIAVIQLAVAFAALLVLPVYAQLPNIVYELTVYYGRGKGAYGQLIVIEFCLAIAVTFVPTFLMGAMFPLATRASARGAADEGAATGRAYGVNTLGTIAGSFLAGFVFLRFAGVLNSVIIASLLSAACGAILLDLVRAEIKDAATRWAPAAVSFMCALGLAVLVRFFGGWDPMVFSSAAFLGNDRPQEISERFIPVYHADGVDLSVTVAQNRERAGELILTVNSKTDASTNYSDMTTQILISHVPALLAPKLENTCVIGLGCGVTLSALALHPEVKHIDCAEISEEVIRGARVFGEYNYHVLGEGQDAENETHSATADARRSGDPDNRIRADADKVRMIRADGRNHLLLTRESYDLIISEPSNPWIAGVSNLFTREFFQLCRGRLNDDGLLCVWLHGYSMSVENFRMVVHTLNDVFDFVAVWEMNEADFALLAARRPIEAPVERVIRRFNAPAVRADLYRVALGRPEKVIGRFITSGEPLQSWAASAPLHTDDNSILEFSAPLSLYDGGWTRTYKALTSLTRSPFDEMISAGSDDPGLRRLVDRVSDVMRARRVRFAARELIGDDLAVLDALLTAYELDPGDRETFLELSEFPNWSVPEFAQSASGREFIRRFQALPLPIKSSMTGMPLDDLARFLVDQTAALPPREALLYLPEAAEIASDDPRVISALIAATARAGDSGDALQLLRDALQAGVLSRPEVRRAADLMKALAEVQGFDALLTSDSELP